MKKILLDTHVFLWWIDNEKHNLLGPKAKKEIIYPHNDIYVSAATAWEIAIKVSLGALSAPSDIDQIVEDKGFTKLPITLFHGQQAGSLPFMKHRDSQRDHKDPFDRMLIAQAQAEGMHLMTRDEVFREYSVRLLDADR